MKNIAIEQLLNVCDLIPNFLFWVKNKKGEFQHVNQAFISSVGVKSIADIYGKTDASFAPEKLVKKFMTDDQEVLSGKLVTERAELNLGSDGLFAWYKTTKRAVVDKNGTVIGTLGFTQRMKESVNDVLNNSEIAAAVNYIQTHFHENITIEQLAKHSFLSISALERRFKKVMAKTPIQYITEVRLEHARLLIVESAIPITQVVEKSGFVNHSYFSKQFKAFFGLLPNELRNECKTGAKTKNGACKKGLVKKGL
jgi:AraC-like DNA-binding protein